MSHCPLCEDPGGELVWRDERARVILADEPDYPGFVRVVWNAHVREMTDLAPVERGRLMSLVWSVEESVRGVLAPDKVNLASLGNLVPHLHWHVIPRWRDDLHFPAAVWAASDPSRAAAARSRRERVAALVPRLRERLARSLG